MQQTFEPQTDRKTILVVDDDPGILKCVSEILADHNYDVLTARSGAEALAQSRNYKRDIESSFVGFPNAGNVRHRVRHSIDPRAAAT